MEYAAAPEYDSTKVRATIACEIRDLYRYRDFLKLLVARTITSRYKRSVLGVAWTLLNPLVSMVVMTIAFSAFFRASVEHYSVYLLAGLTAWNFFSQSTAFAMGQLFYGATLMKRVYLPPTIFAVACIANGIVNLAFSLVPLLAIMLALGHPLHATWWFVPIGVLILSVFSLGVALLMSWLAVLFADAVEMYQLALQALFYLTPILYPRSIVTGRLANWAISLNPLTYMIELLRAPIFEGRLPEPSTVLACALLAVAALLSGAWLFTRKADELAYRI